MKRAKSRSTISLARGLRSRQTDAERRLWNALRIMHSDGLKFRRQHPIGPYIVDFVNLDRKLVVEIDGSQHNESEAQEADTRRTKWLEAEGYWVLRFWDSDVLTNMDGVFATIRENL